jgi:hypothetical protein
MRRNQEDQMLILKSGKKRDFLTQKAGKKAKN